jgi:hypothetical protein
MLERVELCANSNIIKDVILDAMGISGGHTNFDMASKWLCLGCDGDYVFQSMI